MLKCDLEKCKALCCKNLKKMEEVDYSPDDARIIHLVVKPEDYGLKLFPHEKEHLEKLAKKLGIKLVLKTLSIVITKDYKPLILDYFLDHNDCPFLNNHNECRIYPDRPLICRKFPLIDENSISDICPIIKNASGNELRIMPSDFGNSLKFMLASVKINQLINSTINSLAEKGELLCIPTSKAQEIYNQYNGKTSTFLDYAGKEFISRINNLIKKGK